MKKAIAIAAACAVLAAGGTLAAFAAGRITVADVRNIQDGVLGKAPLTDEMDLNSDGEVNYMDMILGRQAMLESTGSFEKLTFRPTAENVNDIGRNYDDGKTVWLVQSGSAVEFVVNARTASVTLAGGSGIDAEPDQRPRYAIYIDGELFRDSTIGSASEEVELFSGDQRRVAKIKIIHLSEANCGPVGVGDITLDTDSVEPIYPSAERELHIEFIGDSITCGYGVEALSNGDSFKTTTENFTKSYAYLACEQLGAEYSAVSYSGHGIISGYTSGDKVENMLVPPYYKNYGSLAEFKKPWDFEANKNDAVVINLGTNDASYIDKDFDARSPEFVEGYESFLETVRECNPDAQIICTLGIMGCEAEYPLIEQAVENFKKNTGDTKISCFKFATQSSDDGYGADWHPSAVTQQKASYVMADKICQALGIPSSQIGLDVAADAVYSINIDSSNGAVAATYYSEYGKSYWVNIVYGGNSAKEIEAVLAPVELKRKAAYRLTLDYTIADGGDVPLEIRSADGSRIVFSDTLKPAGEKAAYSQEFTCEGSESCAVIAFGCGGTDYSNVTLYSVRLEKLS